MDTCSHTTPGYGPCFSCLTSMGRDRLRGGSEDRVVGEGRGRLAAHGPNYVEPSNARRGPRRSTSPRRIPIGKADSGRSAETSVITISAREYADLNQRVGSYAEKATALQKALDTAYQENQTLHRLLRDFHSSSSTSVPAPRATDSHIAGLVHVRDLELGCDGWKEGWRKLNLEGGNGLRQYLSLSTVDVRQPSAVPDTLEKLALEYNITNLKPVLANVLGYDFPLFQLLSETENTPDHFPPQALSAAIAITSRPTPFLPPLNPDALRICVGHTPLFDLKTDQIDVELGQIHLLLEAQDRLAVTLGQWKTGIPQPVAKFTSTEFPFVAGYLCIAGRYVPWWISFKAQAVVLLDSATWEPEDVQLLFEDLLTPLLSKEFPDTPNEDLTRHWTFSNRAVVRLPQVLSRPEVTPAYITLASMALAYRILSTLRDNVEARTSFESYMLGLTWDPTSPGTISQNSIEEVHAEMKGVLMREAAVICSIVNSIRGKCFEPFSERTGQ